MAKKIGAVWKHGEYDTERITPGLLGSKGIKWVGHSTDNPGLDGFIPGIIFFLLVFLSKGLVSIPGQCLSTPTLRLTINCYHNI